jgi:endosialidase-like protein
MDDSQNLAYPLLLQPAGGNVGIGVTSPGALLEVGDSASYSIYAHNFNSGAYAGLFYGGNGSNAFLANYTTSAYWCFIGTPSNAIACSGPTSGVSDERLKKNFRPLSDAEGLQAVMALKPVHYQWKDERKNRNGRYEIGFTAQNVESVLPELVGEIDQPKETADPNVKGKVKSLEYDRIAAPLVKAVQELKADNDNQAAALKAANARLDEADRRNQDNIRHLEEEIAALKAAVKRKE